MKSSHLAVVGVAVLAVTSLAMAGCKSSSTGSSGTPAASSAPLVAPADALSKAMTALNSTSEKFTVSSNGKQLDTGSVDVPNKAADVIAGYAQGALKISYETLLSGGNLYVKLDLGTAQDKVLKIDPTQWMQVDLSKVPNKNSLAIDPDTADPLGMAAAFKAISGVTTTDGKTFTGTIDLTTAGDRSLVVDSALANKYGDKVKAVPITAVVNSAGQLTSFRTDGTAIDPTINGDIEFSDFGHATVTPPASSVPAPAGVYQILNAKI